MTMKPSIYRPAALRRHAERQSEPVLPQWTGRSGLKRARVPILLQMSAVDCGAACLAMVLSYFGRKTGVAECREQCDAGRGGVTAQTLAAAARGLGLRAKAFSLETGDLERLAMPAIIHWTFNHFVVLEKWSRLEAEIVDPGCGRRRVKPREFDECFTGVALTFEPGIHFNRRDDPGPPQFRNYTKRILRVPGTVRLVIQILIASILLQAFGLALPLFTRILVDRLIPLRIESAIHMLGIGGLILVLAAAALSYFRSILLVLFQTRLDSNLMAGFFEHLLSLPFRFFQQRNSGDLLMRLASIAVIRDALASQTLAGLLDGGMVLVYLVVLLRAAPFLALAVLVLGVAQVFILLVTKRRMRGLLERDLSSQAQCQSYLVEALTGIETFKASGAEDRVLGRWGNLFAAYLDVSVQKTRRSAAIDAALMAIRTFSPMCLLWLGGIQVLSGAMTLGNMLAMTMLGNAFLLPLGSLVASAQRVQLVGAHLERIKDVMQAEPEQDFANVKKARGLTGTIELRNVGFRYDSHGPATLRNISFTIEPGQKVALVGRTGSGKSTLAKLLLGLYSPGEGEILYDGVPLRRLNYRTLRSQWGVVLQQSFVFSGSVRQNIAFDEPEISLEEVMRAARIAELHDDIAHMPMAYETILDEGGSSLSGGQRQRLTIARAVARQPAFLLLDEATSHLDVMTETLVDRNLDAPGFTRVVIAHRLSTIRNADLIVVLEDGSIAEQGSHEQLLARCGLYAQLIRSQGVAREGAV
jgi:ABC-type bacteriocin/lantibiotic exporter with double-glycine peptidase domain